MEEKNKQEPSTEVISKAERIAFLNQQERQRLMERIEEEQRQQEAEEKKVREKHKSSPKIPSLSSRDFNKSLTAAISSKLLSSFLSGFLRKDPIEEAAALLHSVQEQEEADDETSDFSEVVAESNFEEVVKGSFTESSSPKVTSEKSRKVPELEKAEVSDFAEVAPKVIPRESRKETASVTIGPISDARKSEEQKILSLLEDLQVTDKFAFLCFGVEKSTSLSVLKEKADNYFEALCQVVSDRVIVLRLYPCRYNQNGLTKLMDGFLTQWESESLGDLVYDTVLSDGEKKPSILLNKGIFTCNDKLSSLRKKKNQQTLSDIPNLEELTKNLTQQIEENVKVQLMRQMEQQLDENGEIYEEELEPVKTADEMTPEEYDSYLSDEQRRIKEEAVQKYVDDDLFIDQILHNIRRHNTLQDPLYLIAIASVDMNTLVILECITDFEELCQSQEISLLQCSYIYSISKSGGHWYGNNHATKAIEELFGDLSDVIVNNGGVFRKELLYAIPNINIFKDIYFL